MQQRRNLTHQAHEKYVSRAAYKLASVVDELKVSFTGKIVLDVGSSTGGFTDFALRHQAKKVIAVDKGTHQMDPVLAMDRRIELYEKTDIRQFKLNQPVDLVLVDLSFVSLRNILPSLSLRLGPESEIIAMVKPQFETADRGILHNGVIKNEHMRRQVLLEFERWLKDRFFIQAKADSKLPGKKGNLERFYRLKLVAKPRP